MKKVISFALLAVFIGLISAKPLLAAKPGNFDFYVLSLSWSPEFCQTHPSERQCGRGYSLVLHGLWPQYQTGYPQFCSGADMPANLVKDFAGLYPNQSLAVHEWQRHGTCSGLSAHDYLQFSQQLKQAFIEPAELATLSKPLRITAAKLSQQIIALNPKLDVGSIAYACTGSGRFLQEIYVCLSKAGDQGVACSAEMQKRSRRSCGKADFLVRNVR